MSTLIEEIETAVGKKAVWNRQPGHIADVKKTWVDITKVGHLLGWKPEVGPDERIRWSVDWYRRNRDWLIKLKR